MEAIANKTATEEECRPWGEWRRKRLEDAKEQEEPSRMDDRHSDSGGSGSSSESGSDDDEEDDNSSLANSQASTNLSRTSSGRRKREAPKPSGGAPKKAKATSAKGVFVFFCLCAAVCRVQGAYAQVAEKSNSNAWTHHLKPMHGKESQQSEKSRRHKEKEREKVNQRQVGIRDTNPKRWLLLTYTLEFIIR
jgi:hypothetical protein